ncbi:MAG: hypothetical protein E7643_00915 [Ruminococcaceae bacterium]|nr:hypothetical protein [Oscillospiraceae bacterium]
MQFLSVLAPLFSFLLWVGIIVGIITFRKQRKKKKEQQLQNDFKIALEKHIQSMENNSAMFRDCYSTLAKGLGVNLKEVDTMLPSLNAMKEHYASVLEDLISISDHNLCLYDKEKLKKVKSESLPTNEQISNHIIEILPLLGNYYEIYNVLKKDIYDDLFFNKIYALNYMAFQLFHENREEMDEQKKKLYDSDVEVFYERVDGLYDIEVEIFVPRFLKSSGMKIANTEKYVKLLIDIGKKHEPSYSKFRILWIKHMQEIAKPYISAGMDLYRFFKEKSEIQENLLPCLNFHLGFETLNYLYIPSTGRTKENCQKLLDLYTSKKASGELFSWKYEEYLSNGSI